MLFDGALPSLPFLPHQAPQNVSTRAWKSKAKEVQQLKHYEERRQEHREEQQQYKE